MTTKHPEFGAESPKTEEAEAMPNPGGGQGGVDLNLARPVITPKPKGPERKEYYCVVPCWHNGTLYKKGQTAWFAGNYPKDLDGNLTHFEPLDPREPPPVMEPPVVTVTPQ